MTKNVFITAWLLLLLSCSKEANVKLPDTKSVPVIYSYICPDDSLIRVKLMASSPLYNSNNIDIHEAVPDADVHITSAQGTAQLVFNKTNKYYELPARSYPVMPGRVYELKVITKNGDVATAVTQVPYSNIPISRVLVENVEEQYQTGDRIQVFFTDEPGQMNYYAVAGLHTFIDSFSVDTIAYDMNIKELYSDAGHDGEEASLTGRFYDTENPLEYTASYYDLFLYNCSPSYYNFQKSLQNSSGDNPFAEPTLIKSNIQNGLGCFGAYTRSRLRYKKK